MKKAVLSLAGLMLASVTAMGAQATAPRPAVGPDPLLTEQSTETFDLDFDGLALSLPVELRDRATPIKESETSVSLNLGTVDIKYGIKNPLDGSVQEVTGWVEIQAGSTSCDARKQFEDDRASAAKNDIRQFSKRIVNGNFDGHYVTSEYVRKGELEGLYLSLYDQKASKCFVFSLAVEEFHGFHREIVKTALWPLTGAINKSLLSYSKNGAAK